jgi:hypothetical protein
MPGQIPGPESGSSNVAHPERKTGIPNTQLILLLIFLAGAWISIQNSQVEAEGPQDPDILDIGGRNGDHNWLYDPRIYETFGNGWYWTPETAPDQYAWNCGWRLAEKEDPDGDGRVQMSVRAGVKRYTDYCFGGTGEEGIDSDGNAAGALNGDGGLPGGDDEGFDDEEGPGEEDPGLDPTLPPEPGQNDPGF